jgi:hypothetical protein
MQSINDAIRALAADDGSSIAKYYNQDPNLLGAIRATLNQFLDSRMDQVRLRHASDFAEATLPLFDLGDARAFRYVVLQREVYRRISYPKQRDHSAHTVNNWLLGWLMFEKVPSFAAKMSQAIKKRSISTGYPEYEVFGDLWMNASLLHDVGYAFEGAIQLNAFEENLQYIDFTLDQLAEYFQYRFWTENGVEQTHHVEALRKWAGVEAPRFDNRASLTGVAFDLRSLGDLTQLQDVLIAHLKTGAGSPVELAPDGFALWAAHFAQYSPTLIGTIKKVEERFQSYLQEGMRHAGVRVLDHGVCGGLMLLQYSTFFYRIATALKSKEQNARSGTVVALKEAYDKLFKNLRYDAEYWWKVVVWSTCATALHNIVQQESVQLSIDDDPLTFLGVLVDSIQCWDRFSVDPGAVFAGDLPAQESDVQVDFTANTATLEFAIPKKPFEKITGELDASLKDWRSYLNVKRR